MNPKSSKADLIFKKKLQEVVKGLNRRMGKKMCDELHGECFDCKTRILIAYLNSWIDIL